MHDDGDSYYQYYSSVNKTNGFQGLFGFSIREMNDQELVYYCTDRNTTLNYTLATKDKFLSNFWVNKNFDNRKSIGLDFRQY